MDRQSNSRSHQAQKELNGRIYFERPLSWFPLWSEFIWPAFRHGLRKYFRILKGIESQARTAGTRPLIVVLLVPLGRLLLVTFRTLFFFTVLVPYWSIFAVQTAPLFWVLLFFRGLKLSDEAPGSRGVAKPLFDLTDDDAHWGLHVFLFVTLWLFVPLQISALSLLRSALGF